MWLLNGGQFLRVATFQSMAFQLPELGFLALAMMVTMLTAGINLSIIASANLSGIVTALILTQTIRPDTSGAVAAGLIALAIGAGLLTSALIGVLNGLLIALLEVPPILVTLGTMILVNGLAIVVTRGYVIAGFPESVLFIGNGLVFGVPVPLIIFLLGAALMGLILSATQLGVQIVMLGSNPTATFFAGVNTVAVQIQTYLLSGLYAGVAAMIMIARFNSAKADYGASYLLLTVLAAVLGGTSAAGGFGTVSGLVLALVILQVISSGLNLLGVSSFLTMAIWGGVLILVMAVNDLRQRAYAQRRTV
ncbi:MAG: ABC transporter permease [Chloroflexales bacterium]|nr:ABC transporter permease [Chloroflexales bacterium]